MDDQVVCLQDEVNEKHVNLDREDGTRVTTSNKFTHKLTFFLTPLLTCCNLLTS